MLRGFERVFLASLPDSLIRPVLLLLFVFFIQFFTDLSPIFALALHFIAAFIALTWVAITVKSCCFDAMSKENRSPPIFHTKIWLKYLIPFSFIAGATIINSRLDLLMLGLLSSKSSVAVYSIALQIASVAIIGQTIVNAIIAPKIARMHEEGNKKELQKLISGACLLSSVIAAISFLIAVVFGRWLTSAMFGEEYSSAYGVMLIVSAGYVLSVLFGPVVLTLNMTGHEQLTARILAASIIINIGLNFIMIPKYGAYGAAMATTTTLLFAQMYCWNELRKTLKVRGDVLKYVI